MKDTLTTIAMAGGLIALAYLGATYAGGVGFGLGDGCCGLYDFR